MSIMQPPDDGDPWQDDYERQRQQPPSRKLQLKPSQHDGLAITSFILAWFVPLIGFILGWVSIATAHREGRRPSGLATAATTIGAIGVVAVIIVVIVLIAHAGQQPDPTQQFITCTNDQINGTPLPSYCASVGVNP